MKGFRIGLAGFLQLVSSHCLSQGRFESLFPHRIDSLIEHVAAHDGPGGSILVQRRDSILYQRSFGFADLRTREPFTQHTIANLGSISKTFVAYGILMLRNEGMLSLEDSIIRFFPAFGNKRIARAVKIRHLLTHTSGLPDLRPVETDSVFYLTADDEQNFAPLQQTDTLEFAPGTKWNYSNPSFNALALIIGKLTGMKWQNFIHDRIFKPSGMTESRITDGAFPDKDVAHGYRWVEGKYEEYDYGEYPTFNAAGNGGVWSSVADLRKYYRAMKNAAFTDSQTIHFSHTVWQPERWLDSIPPRNGFSWFVSHDASKPKLIWHRGEQGGFMAYLGMAPEKDLLMIIEINFVNDEEFLDTVVREFTNAIDE